MSVIMIIFRVIMIISSVINLVGPWEYIKPWEIYNVNRSGALGNEEPWNI